ncbi:MAG: InlB B-repeat-containing protein [Oscillospiraceae bacterium]|nr:InlB B-repeat-containing protein [Oscillospiraceae bacterium]
MKSKFSKLLAIVLCLVMAVGSVAGVVEPTADTVTVTVNFVYDSNKAMVSQPYSAQIAKGTEFKQNVAAPKISNYSVDTTISEGLGTGISYVEDAEHNGSVAFDLAGVTSDITVTLYYVAGQTTYKVHYWLQNLENDEYTEASDSPASVTGDVDAYTNAQDRQYEGFICQGIPQSTIAGDGSTEINIYYNRIYCTVVFDAKGGIDGPAPLYIKYGTVLSDIPASPTRAGYNFNGWSPEINTTVTSDVTYAAKWEEKSATADYTIVFWGQNANAEDEYSYLSSHEAWGNVNSTVNWDESTAIGVHEHTLECYGLSADAVAVDPNDGYGDNDAKNHFEGSSLQSYLVNGSVCMYKDGVGGGKFNYYYFLYVNGNYYVLNEEQYNSLKADEGHSVDDGRDTYSVCAAIETSCTHAANSNTTMASIRPDTSKWKYSTSEEVVINPDGSTVLNVYFNRVEYTLTFNYDYDYYYNNYKKSSTITARWGQNIDAEYKAIADSAGSTFWSAKKNGYGPYTNYFGVMPVGNATYYNRGLTGSSGTMTYYMEDLNGAYQAAFQVNGVGGYTVTDEDRYQFEGFAYDHGTSNGSKCAGAKFYYKRNSYNLSFYSASNSTADKTVKPLYQQNLGSFDYTPTSKPATVESDAVFAGWYQNPECTGEQFILSEYTMPSNDLALYAKWVNRSYTVTTYTDSSMKTKYIYDGYTGAQSVEKYKTGAAPTDPTKDSEVFVGWFYLDENGTEQLFSFTMPVTRDYALYPKFSDEVMVTYTVHYYLEGSTTKLADDRTNSVKFGTTVTEKAKMGTDLNLVTYPNNYFPDKTSTSVVVNSLSQEIIFYYREGATVPYTVNYQDENGKKLIADKVVTDNKHSIVTETYVPIDGYTPKQFQITKELGYGGGDENVLIFVYELNLTSLTITKTGAVRDTDGFIFNVTGDDNSSFKVSVMGNSGVTITGLKVGTKYTVTEESTWSWRYSAEPQEITLVTDAQSNNVTIANSVAKTYLLDGSAYAQNTSAAYTAPVTK